MKNNISERVKKYRYVLAHSGQRCYNSRQLFYFLSITLTVKIRTHIVQKGDYHGIVSNSRARPVPSSERH